MHLFFSRVFIGLSIGGAPGAESILFGVDMEKGSNIFLTQSVSTFSRRFARGINLAASVVSRFSYASFFRQMKISVF